MKLLDKSLEILGLLLFILYIGLYQCFSSLITSNKYNNIGVGMMADELVEIMPIMGIVVILAIVLWVFAGLKHRAARGIVMAILAAAQILLISSVTNTIDLAKKYLNKNDTQWMNTCENVETLIGIITILCIVIVLVAVTLLIAIKSKRLPLYDDKPVSECNKSLRYMMVVLNVLLAGMMSILLMNGYGENYVYEPTMSPAATIAAVEAPLIVFLLLAINGWILDGKNIRAIIGYFVYMALVRGAVEMLHFDQEWYYYQMDMWCYNNGMVFTQPLFGNVDKYMLLVYVVIGIYGIILAWNEGVNDIIRSKNVN